jgi:hypothetical protein
LILPVFHALDTISIPLNRIGWRIQQWQIFKEFCSASVTVTEIRKTARRVINNHIESIAELYHLNFGEKQKT